MKSRLNICLVSPPSYVHMHAFDDIIELLRCTVDNTTIELNHLDEDDACVNLLLGGHLLSGGYAWNEAQSDTELASYAYPGNMKFDPSAIGSERAWARTIIYQFEQLSNESPWWTRDYIAALKKAAVVWDYAQENTLFLASHGIDSFHVPVGYHPALDRMERQHCRAYSLSYPTFDVLFYGSINERRRRVIEDLAKHLEVIVLAGRYGIERDVMTSNARLVLNMHFYEQQVMEWVRIAYLLNNRVPVLCEQSSLTDLGPVKTAKYEDIVETAVAMMSQPMLLPVYGDRCSDWFRRRYPMADILSAGFGYASEMIPGIML